MIYGSRLQICFQLHSNLVHIAIVFPSSPKFGQSLVKLQIAIDNQMGHAVNALKVHQLQYKIAALMMN
jgi:hypothetical protein